MTADRREAIAFAALAAAAAVVWAVVPTYPGYDAYYHLVWGRELLDGVSPSFDAYQAPTQHPLYLVVAALLGALAGQDAHRGLVLVAALSLAALVWAVFRLGRAVFGTWTGVLAALFTGSSFALLLYAARAYVDIPFLAAVFWAAVLEAERPRRGWPVMALLTMAGLLRPEAWILAGGYWLWLVVAGRRAGGDAGSLRPGLLALALSAPVIWALTDLAVTGDPLYSLNATSGLAEELQRERGLSSVPGAFVTFLADLLRPPVFAAALAGLGLALWRREGRSAHVPIGLLLAGSAAFVATGIAGLSILPRYLLIPAVTLTVYAGYALAGWAALPAADRLRRPWAAGVAVLAVAGAAFVVARASVVGRLVNEVRFIQGTHDDLVAILDDPAVVRARTCGPVTLPTYRLVPDVRWILDADRTQVGSRSAKRRETGVALFFTDAKTLRRFGFAQGASTLANVPDPGFVPVARNGRYAAYAGCG